MQYFPSKIESKWQRRWRTEKIYEPDLKRARRPFYNLMMFPYPSAEGLHVGNMYAFTGADIYGRFQRMRGHDVFEPIGLDGFGIHSENYAIKVGRHPAKQAAISEKNFYRQLGIIGNGFAWNERLETYDPEYYRWTQWIFIQLFRRGLAYRKKASVNWCPGCKTVLADEQVEGGACERCGTPVVKKELEQWFFKITNYAERLLANLDGIDWSERVKIAQKNWIGKSEGALVRFPLRRVPGQPDGAHFVEVFTTRPDTIFGATFVAVSAEKAQFWIDIGWQASAAVRQYIAATLARRSSGTDDTDREKEGIDSGMVAVNPASGEEIPVWIVNYVLGDIGTGAIMAVPAHDERDRAFAEKFKLPVRTVIEPVTGEPRAGEEFRRSIVAVVENPKTGKFLSVQWGEKLGGALFVGGGIDGGESPEDAARREVREETGYKNLEFVSVSAKIHHHYVAHSKGVNRNIEAVGFYFRLRDEARDDAAPEADERGKFTIEWLEKGAVIARIKDELHMRVFRSLVLREAYTGPGILTSSGAYDGMDSEAAKRKITAAIGGASRTQYRLRDWLISRQRYWGPPIPMIFCTACAAAARGERKDMPGWFAVPEKDLPVKLPHVAEFRPTGTDRSPLAAVEKFYNVRCPECGSRARRETDVSDTFLDSAWYYLGYLMQNQKSKTKSPPWDTAIAKKWLPVDMYIGGAEHAVLHLLYVRFLAMVFKDMGFVAFEEPFKKFRAHGLIIKDGAKMSKSKGNVVNPDEYIRAYGADALRMYLMFLGPFEAGGDFRDSGIKGITRFLERAWNLAMGPVAKSGEPLTAMHKRIKKVTDDVENLRYNTATSELMILSNELEANKERLTRGDIEIFLKLLAPFAPHMTEELWRGALGNKISIHRAAWPEYDPKMVREDAFDLVVQVNGRPRGRATLPVGVLEAEARAAALALPGVKKYITAEPRKVIYVPNKLINFVV